jgi:stearoyl-CoA 9-desaturase NADPH oxidoreductase
MNTLVDANARTRPVRALCHNALTKPRFGAGALTVTYTNVSYTSVGCCGVTRVYRRHPQVMNAIQTSKNAARSIVRHIAQSRQVDFWMQEFSKTWSLTEIRARVVEVIDESHDVRTFVLAPNRHWPGHRAGQFVSVEVEVDGVRLQRCYSISSAPGDAQLKITVKRVPGGRVSSWMHDKVHVGAVLGLSKPAGEFTANIENFSPGSSPQKWLLVSGGSGVTPVMSILRDFVRRRVIGDVVFLHAARSQRDMLFQHELAAIAAAHSGLRVAFFLDDDARRGGRLDRGTLAAAVPDFAERQTLLCGPAPMMAALSPLWVDCGISQHLKTERFSQLPRTQTTHAEGKDRVHLHLLRSERVVAASDGATLLEQLEAAGERPKHGCRMGVCNTCACRKHSGIVENILTGEISTEPNETIRLCISRAKTDVELAL